MSARGGTGTTVPGALPISGCECSKDCSRARQPAIPTAGVAGAQGRTRDTWFLRSSMRLRTACVSAAMSSCRRTATYSARINSRDHSRSLRTRVYVSASAVTPQRATRAHQPKCSMQSCRSCRQNVLASLPTAAGVASAGSAEPARALGELRQSAPGRTIGRVAVPALLGAAAHAKLLDGGRGAHHGGRVDQAAQSGLGRTRARGCRVSARSAGRSKRAALTRAAHETTCWP
jgi:hypothetical protein